jgi:hypothetical protein
MTNRENKERLWTEAKRRCRLSLEEIAMAKKLGLNPLSLIKNVPSPTERWKAPVQVWIRKLYEKRFNRKGKGKIFESSNPAPTIHKALAEGAAERPLIWDTHLDDLVEGPLPDSVMGMDLEIEGSKEEPF